VSASKDFGAIMTAWAERTPSVNALTLIGSRERKTTDVLWRPDKQSDWDFQIVTSTPEMFANGTWTRELQGPKLLVYSARVARIGGVPKINAIFEGAEVDFVVVPIELFKKMKRIVARGLHRKEGEARQFIQNLAVVIRPGWRFLKGAEHWDALYRQAIAEVTDPRLSDDAALQLANGFVCDLVWTRRKIERGELSAAQRMLHRELAETNFRLLHELKLRQGKRSFPEARRLELLKDASATDAVSVSARLESKDLTVAVKKSAVTLRRLMKSLVGARWQWPTGVARG
jgi:hypothetical protein